MLFKDYEVFFFKTSWKPADHRRLTLYKTQWTRKVVVRARVDSRLRPQFQLHYRSYNQNINTKLLAYSQINPLLVCVVNTFSKSASFKDLVGKRARHIFANGWTLYTFLTNWITPQKISLYWHPLTAILGTVSSKTKAEREKEKKKSNYKSFFPLFYEGSGLWWAARLRERSVNQATPRVAPRQGTKAGTGRQLTRHWAPMAPHPRAATLPVEPLKQNIFHYTIHGRITTRELGWGLSLVFALGGLILKLPSEWTKYKYYKYWEFQKKMSLLETRKSHCLQAKKHNLYILMSVFHLCPYSMVCTTTNQGLPSWINFQRAWIGPSP